MSFDTIILIIVTTLGFGFVAYLIVKIKGSTIKDQSMIMQLLQQQTNSLNSRLDHTVSVVSSVQRAVGEMSEIGHNIQEIQQLLHAPKLRGAIGEQILNQLLSQVFPHTVFTLQHRFKSGSVVDAVIKTQNGLIPIDAKFPLSSYLLLDKSSQKAEQMKHRKQFTLDVKKHIESISQKYILPEEKTIDYALMYIPSEAVYYEVVNNATIVEYASNKRVLPVSPITFYAFMKTILVSLEGERMNARAQEIIMLLRSLQGDYNKVERSLETLTRHVTNSYNALSQLTSAITHIGQKVNKTVYLDKPDSPQLP